MLKHLKRGITTAQRPIVQLSKFGFQNHYYSSSISPFILKNTRSYSNYTYQRFNNQRQRSFYDYLNDPKSRKSLALVLGAASLFYVTHLEEAPVSGRKRFIFIPRSLEMKIGSYSYNSIIQETANQILPQNHPLTRKIQSIFAKIVDAAYKDPTVDKYALEGIKWKIHVVNDPRAPPNAFVLPGGKVFVFSSMLNICQNDDGIATVLSHEFAHQLARHTSENLSKAPVYSLISLLVYALTGIQGINDFLTDGLLRMPASRQMETEADYIGLMIMARACFNPDESVKLWERMSAFEQKIARMSGQLNFEFLSTHPASLKRIKNMTKWLPEANSLYEQSDCGQYGKFYENFQNVVFGPSSSEELYLSSYR
ncbi:hypothetical protein KAFR_0H00300 [Kazachstania africana CBS 2517]|uniref:Peptidase M48 domain-containing protein n=1 Tax=Kazachstania africana (strain ATCC 22294 / BCRC 22015 / CBS 2517 / CECT 1963 / NBRC 1671 / NRRL Y-8276) TaxID=1071382 RepID=H2AYN3_KAZAF|nr:hypothetical protein KAFR_0H00300 [Kazachstania africana CBS 2517]CCF59439.1 hypothetical protein KAFR_0H00300 [Kazachstania africana CBS 2517]